MRIPVSGGTLFCRVFDAIDASPLRGRGTLLFVHGFPISGQMWLPTVERFGPTLAREDIGDAARGRDGWRFVVPDLRGHGESDVSDEMTIERFADDLSELLDALGEKQPVVVVGLSMGGIISMELCRGRPQRVRALGLIDTRANAETPESAARREAVAQAALRDGAQAAVDPMMDTVFAAGFPREQREHWYTLMCRTPAGGVAAAARALAQRREYFSLLPRISCPTLVVVGEQDAITPPATLREIADGIRGARFATIAGAGHVPPVERPGAFAAVLRDFLNSLE